MVVVVVQMAVRPNADMERPYHKLTAAGKRLTEPCDCVNAYVATLANMLE